MNRSPRTPSPKGTARRSISGPTGILAAPTTLSFTTTLSVVAPYVCRPYGAMAYTPLPNASPDNSFFNKKWGSSLGGALHLEVKQEEKNARRRYWHTIR